MTEPRDPANTADPVDDLDTLQRGLLNAARLLYAAARYAEAVQADDPWESSLTARMVESDIKIVLWQAVALLSPALRLDTHHDQHPFPAVDQSAECLRLLRSAAVELDSIPLADGRAGVATMSVDLHAAIARTADLAQR